MLILSKINRYFNCNNSFKAVICTFFMPEIIEKAKDFVQGLRAVEGALVVGSAAYGQHTPKKDVDMMIISSDILDTLTSPSLQKLDELARLKAEARLKYPNHSHCFKGRGLDGILWSPAIYTPETFEKIIDLRPEYITYVRNTYNAGIKVELFNFRGERREHNISNTFLSSGYFLANEPICFQNGSIYFGPAPDALLKSPVVCADNNGKLECSMYEFWDKVFSVMSIESRNPKELLSTEKLPILSKKDLPESVYEYIRRELSSAGERAENRVH